MRKQLTLTLVILLLVLLGAVPFSQAQFQNGYQSRILNLPLLSQRAVVTQTVGITDITLSYHRPLVNGRKIWGGIAPYGKVWRAGANENTTIEFSDPVTVEGKPLDKGIYGLHMIPGETEWTIIFSKSSVSWGSYTYDEKEDALRVTVKPQPADFHEALTYDFDDLKPDSTLITLRWEKLAVPFKVAINVNDLLLKSLQDQFRGYPQYLWYACDDAATYLLENKLSLDEALKYSDKSIQMEEVFENLLTRARILDAMGRKDEAKTALAKALDKGGPFQLHSYGLQLIGQGQQEQAFEVFRANIKKNPTHWIAHVEEARIDAGHRDFENALKHAKLALDAAPDNAKPQVQGFIKRLEAKEDVNK